MNEEQNAEDSGGKIRREYVDTQGLYDGLYELANRVDVKQEAAICGGFLQIRDFYAAVVSFADRLLPLVDNAEIVYSGKKIKAKELIDSWIEQATLQINFMQNRMSNGTKTFEVWQALSEIKRYLHLAGLKSGALQKQEYERSVKAAVRESFR